MPVDERHKLPAGPAVYMRDQYAGSAITRWFTDFRDRRIFSFLRPDDRRIVDIGCGEGITLEYLKGRFPERRVEGIDAEAENIDICLRHGLTAQHGTVYALPFRDAELDCCYLTDVIEHLDRPEAAVSEVHRVLRPGGRLIIVFPRDVMFTVARLMTGKFSGAFYFPGHVRQWTPREMSALLNREGFSLRMQQNLPFFFWTISLYHLVVADRR